MYYKMDWKVDYEALGLEMVFLTETPAPEVAWTMGVRCPYQVKEPILCHLDPESGSTMPDLIPSSPLFSQRFIDALKRAGVRNMDIYDAEVIDRKHGKTYSQYKAVNIIGLVSCANLENSEYAPNSKPPFMKFERLVIDESLTLGLPLFRLAEATQFILVSEQVKLAVEEANLLGVRIVSLENPLAY